MAIKPDDNEKLVRTNIGWMLALAQRMVGDRALAEDAVQDAFIAAFLGMPSPDEPLPDDVPEDLIKAILEARRR